MNIAYAQGPHFHTRLRRLASPPKPRQAESAKTPADQVDISQASSFNTRQMSKLRAGASLFAVGLSLVSALGAAGPAAAQGVPAEPEVSQATTIEALIRQVLSEGQTSLQKLSNPRFSSFKELDALSDSDTIAKGEEGPHMVAVQQALLDMGFAIEAGPTGGFYNQTINALNNFRASVDLEPSQDLDGQTLRMLDQLAPPPGKNLSEHPTASFPQARIINGRPARVTVKLDEHRLFLYKADGTPDKVFPVATGKASKPTDPGVKIVNFKYDDPSPVAWQLWPESGGKAFGTRMIDLRWYNTETGETTSSDEEIHGTFARNSIGTDASSGCVRMYNEHVETLYPQLTKGDLVVFE